MKDKEIELKFKINSDTRARIIADLESNAQLLGTTNMIDTYYVPNFKDFEIGGKTIECVRIRESENCVLCYKHIHYEASPIYCDEYETKIEDKSQMEKILFALGFEVQMVIDKTRVSFKLDNFEFDFDTVKNLGEFMEVELTDNNASVDKIYEYVSKYGLTSQDVTYEGIQKLMKKQMSK